MYNELDSYMENPPLADLQNGPNKTHGIFQVARPEPDVHQRRRSSVSWGTTRLVYSTNIVTLWLLKMVIFHGYVK